MINFTQEQEKIIKKKVEEAFEREKKMYTPPKVLTFLQFANKYQSVQFNINKFASNPWSYSPSELENIVKNIKITDGNVKTLLSSILKCTNKEFQLLADKI